MSTAPWHCLQDELPPRTGNYRVRNGRGLEAFGHFTHPDGDEFGGGWHVDDWPGGNIIDWMEIS